MWLCECKYICMKICIYVVMFVLPTSHNPLQRYFNDEAYQLHQKDPDIVSQKLSLFGAYGKFGWSLPPIYTSLYFMICPKDFFFFFEKFYHGGTQIYQISAQGQVKILPCEGNSKFCYRRIFLLGCGNLTRGAFEYSNLFQS